MFKTIFFQNNVAKFADVLKCKTQTIILLCCFFGYTLKILFVWRFRNFWNQSNVIYVSSLIRSYFYVIIYYNYINVYCIVGKEVRAQPNAVIVDVYLLNTYTVGILYLFTNIIMSNHLVSGFIFERNRYHRHKGFMCL